RPGRAHAPIGAGGGRRGGLGGDARAEVHAAIGGETEPAVSEGGEGNDARIVGGRDDRCELPIREGPPGDPGDGRIGRGNVSHQASKGKKEQTGATSVAETGQGEIPQGERPASQGPGKTESG